MQAAVLFSHCWLFNGCSVLHSAVGCCHQVACAALCTSNKATGAFKRQVLQQDGHVIDDDGRRLCEWCGGAYGRGQIACSLRRSAALMHASTHPVCTLRVLACSWIKIMQ
jgi:hypothetical protein